MFQNLKIMWQNPSGRRKIYFFLGVGVALSLLIYLIIQVNFGAKKDVTNVASLAGKTGFKEEVTSKSFTESKILEKVDGSSVGSGKVAFASNGSPIFLNSSMKLRLNGKDLVNSPDFAPSNIINSAEGIVVNEPLRSTVILPDNRIVKQGAAFSLTQYFTLNNSGVPTSPKWAYLNYSNNLYSIFSASNINLVGGVEVASLSPTISAKMAELVNFNQQIYFIAWENPSRQGKMEVWQIREKSSPQKIFSKDQVQSVHYGPDSLLVTTFNPKPSELTLYKNTLVDFKLNPSGNPVDLQLDFNLSQNKVFGSLLAERCVLSLDSTAYCLVKQSKVPSTVFTSKDVVLKINLATGAVSKLQENLAVSAASIYMDGNQNLHIVSAEDRILYKVKV